jgi:signal transduction histidine kinase
VIREISCRTSNTIIQYIKRYAPDKLPMLLEDLNEDQLTTEREWISYQTANLLYRRAEKALRRDDIMVEIGRSVMNLDSIGIAARLLRLAGNVSVSLSFAAHYARLLENISAVSVLEREPQHCRIEDRCLPGYIRTRGACNFTRGLLLAILKSQKASSAQVHETHCAVPIWEKGVLEQSYFFLRDRRVIRKDLLSGEEADLGPLAPDGSFEFGGTLYGAPSCIYNITWDAPRNLWRWFLDYLFLRPRLLGKIRRELLDKYEIIDKQNNHLRRTNQVLANLLKERTELNLNLEAKVGERTRELEFNLERLKELDQLKSNFLSVTSHELRTPLTVIKAALSLLLTEGHSMDGARYRKYLNMAYDNCENLIRLIDDLLDFSRLESGRMRLELKGANLPVLIQDTVKDFQAAASCRGVELTGVLPVELPLVIASPVRIKQVLSNLISNALKFTPSGGQIKISLRQDGSFAEIEVTDTGIGMSEMQQKRVFSKFFQVDDSLTREVGGVGLGLALVKKLVEMHDGLVWVESKEGLGSSFFVRLPFRGPKRDLPGSPKSDEDA